MLFIKKIKVTGELLEPIEEITCDIDNEHASLIIEKLSNRQAELLDYQQNAANRSFLKFHIPTRGILGYRSEFNLDTRGNGILNQIFIGYKPKIKASLKKKKRFINQ